MNRIEEFLRFREVIKEKLSAEFNIQDVGGNTEAWNDHLSVAILDLRLSDATVVSGDFDAFHGPHGVGDDGAHYEFNDVAFSAYGDQSVENWPFGTLTANSEDGTYTFVADWDAVLASGESQIATFTVTPWVKGHGVAGAPDRVVVKLLICVARGTMIATPNGAVPVETLAPGDLVETVDGPAQPVRWVGSRIVTEDELAANPALRPWEAKLLLDGGPA